MNDDIDKRMRRIVEGIPPVPETVERAVTELKTALALLGDRLAAHAASADALGNRIWWLNVWLLVVTVAIGLMTLVQALAAWRVLMR